MTASRIGRFVTTSPEMRRASSTGTELPDRMLSVRVKRAVLNPRVSLPMSGRLSCVRCHLRRAVRILQPARNPEGCGHAEDDHVEQIVPREVADGDEHCA